jgi:hypothetical protein
MDGYLSDIDYLVILVILKMLIYLLLLTKGNSKLENGYTCNKIFLGKQTAYILDLLTKHI